jgi:hypothetical protein
MKAEIGLILFAPAGSGVSMVAEAGVGAGFSNDDRLPLGTGPFHILRVLGLAYIPADVLVDSEDVEILAERIIQRSVGRAGPLGAIRANVIRRVGSSRRASSARCLRNARRSGPIGVSFKSDQKITDARCGRMFAMRFDETGEVKARRTRDRKATTLISDLGSAMVVGRGRSVHANAAVRKRRRAQGRPSFDSIFS